MTLVELLSVYIHTKPAEKYDTRKVKILSLPETIKEKSTFRAKLTPDKGPSLETSIFPLSFQVVRETLNTIEYTTYTGNVSSS